MRTNTRWPGDEGYDRMNFARGRGWKPISSWGLDGWDLGRWPLVIVYHHGDTEFAIDVEGDITIETIPGRDERDRKTDETAFFYWKNHGEEWVKDIASHEDMSENLRGAFSWKRLRGRPPENENGSAQASRAPHHKGVLAFGRAVRLFR